MPYQLLKRLFTKQQYITELGRWNTNKNSLFVVKNIDFANHDHCGGELCKIPVKKKEEKKNDDYYIPFLL
tara:strand:- start:149 stop:358 length:210 start_codon:yes stop_codon:yes gene_type:complete